jgi:hypothetical protein
MNSVTDFTDSWQRFFGLSRLSSLPGNIEKKLLTLAAGTSPQPHPGVILSEKKSFLKSSHY